MGGFSLAILLRKVRLRLQLSLAKHRSLTGHSRMARRFASLVPFYEYGESQFFSSDGAPENIAAARRAGFARLSEVFSERFKKTAALTGETAGWHSPLNRVAAVVIGCACALAVGFLFDKLSDAFNLLRKNDEKKPDHSE